MKNSGEIKNNENIIPKGYGIKCPFCNDRFGSDKDLLKRHLKESHKKESKNFLMLMDDIDSRSLGKKIKSKGE